MVVTLTGDAARRSATIRPLRRGTVSPTSPSGLIRHAREHRLRLPDIIENAATDGVQALARRLAPMVTRAGVRTLLTDGVRIDLAQPLAADLGLDHQAAPSPSQP